MDTYVMNQQVVPRRKLRTNRSLLKHVLLGFITFGIYDIVDLSGVENSLNLLASRYDGKKTMDYCLLLFVIDPLTLGIGSIIWTHRICNRMGNELSRRGISYTISATDFWLWGVLGSLIVIGPFIFLHKFLKASNLLCEDYNRIG